LTWARPDATSRHDAPASSDTNTVPSGDATAAWPAAVPARLPVSMLAANQSVHRSKATPSPAATGRR